VIFLRCGKDDIVVGSPESAGNIEKGTKQTSMLA